MSLVVGSKVTVFTTEKSSQSLGTGVVKDITKEEKVTVNLGWKLADGRPATIYTQASCLRVKSPLVELNTEVSVLDKRRKVFVNGTVTAVRNPNIVTVDLQWKLADGNPAKLYTPAANLQTLAKTKALALARHSAQFKSRTKVCVLSADGSGKVLTTGTVTRNRYRNKSCILDLHWRLADGKHPKLYITAQNLRLPSHSESLSEASKMKDKGGVLFSKKKYYMALQVSTAPSSYFNTRCTACRKLGQKRVTIQMNAIFKENNHFFAM